MRQLTERELIAQCQLGERAAISELFERHYGNSLNVARRLLYSAAEAEDAVQAAYCAAFQNLDSFRSESSFRSWITRIVVNRCLMTVRDPWRRRRVCGSNDAGSEILELMDSPAASPEESTWRLEVAVALRDAIVQLPPKLRRAYTLYAVSEMPMEEVATALGVSIAAAKSRVFRARGAMRLSLGTVWHGRHAPADADAPLN